MEGTHVELFHHSTAYQAVATEPDEWLVKNIVDHRQRPDGQWEFLTEWEHAEPGERTWEPAAHFITRYCAKFPAYLRARRLSVPVTEVFLGAEGK